MAKKVQKHIVDHKPVSAIAKRCRKCIRRVSYKECRYLLRDEGDGSLAMHVQRSVPCSDTGEFIYLNSEKWYFADGDSEAYIMQCMFRMIVQFEDHERRENFRVDGEKIFDPHKVITPFVV